MFNIFAPKIREIELFTNNGKYCVKYRTTKDYKKNRPATELVFGDISSANIKLKQMYKRAAWYCVVKNTPVNNASVEIRCECNYYYFNKCCESVR